VLDQAGLVDQESARRQAAGRAFYHTSKFTLRARASRQQLKADFAAYLDGFSPNVQDILQNFEFRNHIPRLSKADALGTLIEKLTSPDVNLSLARVKNADGSVRHPGLDNHCMGSIFEELVRRFSEENNEQAGEHWTPGDAVQAPLPDNPSALCPAASAPARSADSPTRRERRVRLPPTAMPEPLNAREKLSVPATSNSPACVAPILIDNPLSSPEPSAGISSSPPARPVAGTARAR